MADYTTWRRNGFENSRPAPDGWPQFNAPRTVNDIGREMQSAMARRRDRFGDYPTSTGEDSNVYRVELPSLTLTEIPVGFRVGFAAHQSSIADDASFQVNDIAPATLYGSEDTGIAAADIVAGRRYDLIYTTLGWAILFLRQTDSAGLIDLSAVPNTLAGVDVGSVDGITFSSAATGEDADTLYFRTAAGGSIHHGPNRILSIAHGSTSITNVLHGGNHVYAIARAVTNLATTLSATLVTVTWDAPAISSQPVTYRVQRSMSASFGTLESDDVVAMGVETFSYPVSAFSSNSQYIRVRTENHIGDSVYAVSDAITFVRPGFISNVSIFPVGNTLRLEWNPPTGTRPFSYRVRRTLGGSFTTFFTPADQDNPFYVDVNLGGFSYYCYEVRAINTAGSGPDSNSVCENSPF